jgi:hypothetical protein
MGAACFIVTVKIARYRCLSHPPAIRARVYTVLGVSR